MKFELQKFNFNVSSEELIADVRRVATELKQDALSVDAYDQYGKFNSSTLKRRFGGSWLKVLAAANLQITDKQSKSKGISNEELFKDLEEVWTKLGRQPRSTEMKLPLSKYEASTYKRRFGGWMKALETFVNYINADRTDEVENINNPVNEITSVDETSGQVFKHKTKRDMSDRLRFKILMRDGFTCNKCGRSPIKERDVELHVDHILPWSKGGETTPENLETKCSQCNLGKGNAFNQ